MNWKDLHKKYPLAFREYLRSEDIISEESETIIFTETDTDNFTYFFETNTGEGFCIDGEEVFSLPHYFDGLGIHVNAGENYEGGYVIILSEQIMYNISSLGEWFDLVKQIKEPNTKYLSTKTFPTRLEALKAGVEKAFSIRESQIATCKNCQNCKCKQP